MEIVKILTEALELAAGRMENDGTPNAQMVGDLVQVALMESRTLERASELRDVLQAIVQGGPHHRTNLSRASKQLAYIFGESDH
jgi:hypothetical protein